MSLRRSAAAAACAAVLFVAAAGRPQAWGFEAHRFITARAVELLPPELRPFFRKHAAAIVEHSIDPDLWRNAGWEEEPPRHFLDLDAYGPPPFDALPRDYDQAVAKHGIEKIRENGLLPWRTEEMYGRLVRAFTDHRNGRPFARENIKFFTSVLSHYISDAHVPFHAVVNYDGQLTGQHGIHARFESEMFERYRGQLSIRATPIVVTKGVRDFTFDTLLESQALVAGILEADREAIGSRDLYDRRYFREFFAKTRPALERRLAGSIAAVAAIVTKAWEEAGRPALPVDPPPRTARTRKQG